MEARSLVVGGEILIYGYIGSSEWNDVRAKDVAASLAELAGEDDITVRINSIGGGVYEGIAIYSLLRARAEVSKINVVIDGIAASIATIVAMAGDDIAIAEDASFMIHNPWTIAIGESQDLRKSADELDRLTDQMVAVYERRSKNKAEDISSWMDAETWYGGAEAVEAGFCDRVIEVEAPAEAMAFDYTKFEHAPAPLVAAALAAAAAQPARKEPPMSQTPKADDPKAAVVPTPPANPDPAPAPAVPAVDEAAVRAEAQRAERDRVTGIQAACRAAKLDQEFADQLIKDGTSIDDARAQIIDRLAESDDTPEPQNHIRVTADAVDRWTDGATASILAKVGLEGGERNEFSGLSLVELARGSLEIRNVRGVGGMDRMKMLAMAIAPMAAGAGHSTSDFANLLANVAHKSMLKGYEEAAETFQIWTSRGILTDFKTKTKVDAGMFPSLDKVEEGAEYKYATMSDRAVTLMLATYGKLFKIFRQTIINDDLDAFSKVPMKMGRAAKRTVATLVYAVLNDNAAFVDGTALFHADHANLGTAGAPSITTFEEAVKLMMDQTDPDGHADGGLNIRPKYVINGSATMFPIQQLLKSETDPSKTNSKIPNTVQGIVEQITDSRVAGNTYYFAADPAMHDTVEVSYLDGVDTPYLEQKDGFDIDAVSFKVRIDAGVDPLDFRGLVKNAGA